MNPRVLRFAVFFGLFSALASVAAVEGGIYELAGETPARRLEIKVVRAEVTSESNANDKWTVEGSLTSPGIDEAKKYAMVLDGVVYGFDFWYEAKEGHQCFGISAIGRRQAEAVGKVLGVEPFARKHVGHKVDVVFAPSKPIFTVGEPLIVKMTITNLSDKPLYFRQGGQQRGPRDDQFSFSCTKAWDTPRIKTAFNFGGAGANREIPPGKAFSLEQDLAAWVDLDRPGEYQFVGTYEFPIHDIIEYRVPFDPPIWMEYLARPFTIVMKEMPFWDRVRTALNRVPFPGRN